MSRSSPSGRRQKVQKWATSRRSQECLRPLPSEGRARLHLVGVFMIIHALKLFVFATLFSLKSLDEIEGDIQESIFIFQKYI